MAQLRRELKKNSSLLKKSLYQLENYFGESTGHGVGFGGEDIDWTIDNKNLFIELVNNYITIKWIRYNENLDEVHLRWKTMPKEIKSKLRELLKKHTRGPLSIA